MVIRHLWPALLWSLIVLVLSLIPGQELPEVHIFQVDKLVHFFFFGLLMVLTAYSFLKLSRVKNKAMNEVLISVVYSLTLGILIEILQKFVPGRSFSFVDMLANSIGVLIGYFIFNFIKRKFLNVA